MIYITAISAVLLILIIVFTVLFAVRYRRSRNPKVSDTGGNWKLEALWIGLATVIVMTMFFAGLGTFKYLRKVPADSLKVDVTGMQWSWEFKYANGRTTGNLVVPQGKDIALDMKTPDVLHGFFIPAFRIKQDIVPGMTNHLWFNSKDPGTYDILCTQYCGEEHSKMLTMIYVVPPDVYEKWYAGEKVDIPGRPADSE